MRPQHEYEEAMRWLTMGLTSRAVADLMGIPFSTIKGWRQRGRSGLKGGSNHSRATFDEAMRYAALGMNDCAISRLMLIPRSTIRDWRVRGRKGWPDSDCPICDAGKLPEANYAYLLGLYLGDRCISPGPRGVFRLRISLDMKYPGIIEDCARTIASMRPPNAMKVGRTRCEGCIEVNASWKHWPCLFPQHGPGRKHERPILLESWQLQIVDRYPKSLLRGLIQSDGCRSINTIRVGDKKYKYPRYQFSNNSIDIQRIFCGACDVVGMKWKQMNWKTIAVSRRDDVARMDEFIGPKK